VHIAAELKTARDGVVLPRPLPDDESVEPGLYSQRSTLVVRNDFTLKFGSPSAATS
jgi:hypothetical protein